MCSCFLELCPLKKYFSSEGSLKQKQCLCPLNKFYSGKKLKIKMMFTYFWLSYCDEYHIERIPIAVKNINHLFHLVCQIMKADRLHLFLLSGGTRIDEDEYLSSLEDRSELIVCTKEPVQKFLVYFQLKKYLRLKNGIWNARVRKPI